MNTCKKKSKAEQNLKGRLSSAIQWKSPFRQQHTHWLQRRICIKQSASATRLSEPLVLASRLWESTGPREKVRVPSRTQTVRGANRTKTKTQDFRHRKTLPRRCLPKHQNKCIAATYLKTVNNRLYRNGWRARARWLEKGEKNRKGTKARSSPKNKSSKRTKNPNQPVDRAWAPELQAPEILELRSQICEPPFSSHNKSLNIHSFEVFFFFFFFAGANWKKKVWLIGLCYYQ